MRRLPAGLLALILLLTLWGGPAPAAAETTAPASGLDALVDQARKDGMTVVVISPPAATAPAAATPADAGLTIGIRLREEVRRLIVTSPDMPRRVATTFEIISQDGHRYWLAGAVLTALAGLLAGYFARRLIGRWGREYFRYMWNPAPVDDAERIGYLLFRAALQTVYTAVVFGVAMLVAIILDTGHEPSRSTILIIVSAYCLWRIMREVVAFNLLAPDVPSHRMLNLSDADAIAIFRDMQWVFALAITVLAFSTWIGALDLDGDANKLLLILASLIAATVIGYLTIKYRRAVAGVILGVGPAYDKPLWRRLLAGSWHIIGLIYLVASTIGSIARLLLGLPSANALISAPVGAVLAGITAYGILYLLIERYFRARAAAFARRLAAAIRAEIEQREQEEAARREAVSEAIASGEEVVENIAGAPVSSPQLPQYRPLFKPLAQRAAGVAVTIVALGLVLGAWGVSAGERGNPVTGFMDVLVVAFVAWVLYGALSTYVDAKLEEEGEKPHGGPIDPDEESAGHGATRLGTLLPLVRNVLSVTIVVVAGMIVLSGLGVDIAPLFAGAGVVGLAIGFGAQTLIRDIFSGGFFLFDDAFRKGEYIELGNVRGTVEKISLRSFQLRHHNGPLHTIPFGEIKQLTNYSRDWVIMKLPLRLTFDTDVEKVRKLVKKLGQELLEHPEVGNNFLQPLKSQGVVEMDDSAMILRVKFMTKPGDQWVTRKVVYASIQELFRREGIRFANKEVTVRIHDDTGHGLTPQQIEAAGAAARRLIDDQSGKAPARSADDR